MSNLNLRTTVQQNLLSPNLWTVGLRPVSVPDGSNLGAFETGGGLVIPVGNAGTVITAMQKLKDYLWIDVNITGTAALVAAYGKGLELFSSSKGINGVQKGTYTLRIPYVGEIDKIIFYQSGNYTVTSIVAYSSSDYWYTQYLPNEFKINPALANLDPQANGAASLLVYPGTSVTVTFVRNLAVTAYGVLDVTSIPVTGMSYFDGVNISALSTIEGARIVIFPTTPISPTLTISNPTVNVLEVIFIQNTAKYLSYASKWRG